MSATRGVIAAALLAAAFAACAHDPARDEPIVPWGSANDAPTGEAGDAGGWRAEESANDADAGPDAAP